MVEKILGHVNSSQVSKTELSQRTASGITAINIQNIYKTQLPACISC